MKKIGLIGGITWQSTQLYYQLLNTRVAELLGGQNSCECLIESVNFADISTKQAKGDWNALHTQMTDIAVRLEKSGAEVILICANTMHLSVPTIKEKITVPLLHIAEVAGNAVKEKGCKKVLLLGTKYTMELDFYKDILKNRFGIEVLIPNEADREIVHKIIYSELSKGITTEESKQLYLDIIKKSKKEGAEGVILGCTEIPLLIQQEDCDIVVIDTTKEHAFAAVEFALS
ncbi:aspartate/glutamate racemase family protein [Maribacter arcticus]|uniref:Aspartate racemase n=1 Tax=Maribacter arcticus TaxID=561365 RepID=A0A1T5D1Y0_9FLAO|nr:aspartate/glutamate racemase family protein [Maribacter arcticus]SKB65679.1 aspartate racemase [Maribacter arcticus]|tara:strand:- start:1407 stop:2099 length:693 start_codon:yes stop_codon:yes gene_type:complete